MISKPMTRDQIARAFLFEALFESVKEIDANPDHHLVRAAYRAADKIIAALSDKR